MVMFIGAYQCSKCLRFYEDKAGTNPARGNVAWHRGKIVCRGCADKPRKDQAGNDKDVMGS